MSTPQPFPWQVDTGLTGTSKVALYLQYDDANERAREAARVGQWEVEKAWKDKAHEIAEQIVELARTPNYLDTDEYYKEDD